MSWPGRLEIPRAQLLVIDLQQRLLPHIAGVGTLLAQTERMIRIALAMGLPVTLTEQYPQGLGATDGRITAAAGPARVFEKSTFSAWDDPPARAALTALGRPQVLIAGIETHVCVQQTALGMQAGGLHPVVLADAVGSRRPEDRQTALERLRQAGVVVTTVESAAYELMERSGTELFRRVLPLLK